MIHESESLSLSGRSSPKSDESKPSLDAIFTLLSNSRRRGAIVFLLEAETNEVDFTSIVDHVASTEFDKPVEQLDSSQRHTVYTSLYQSHLPKLEKHGVVEYERPSGTVRQGPNAGLVQRYLDAVEGVSSPRWSYRGLTAMLGTVLFAR